MDQLSVIFCFLALLFFAGEASPKGWRKRSQRRQQGAPFPSASLQSIPSGPGVDAGDECCKAKISLKALKSDPLKTSCDKTCLKCEGDILDLSLGCPSNVSTKWDKYLENVTELFCTVYINLDNCVKMPEFLTKITIIHGAGKMTGNCSLQYSTKNYKFVLDAFPKLKEVKPRDSSRQKSNSICIEDGSSLPTQEQENKLKPVDSYRTKQRGGIIITQSTIGNTKHSSIGSSTEESTTHLMPPFQPLPSDSPTKLESNPTAETDSTIISTLSSTSESTTKKMIMPPAPAIQTDSPAAAPNDGDGRTQAAAKSNGSSKAPHIEEGYFPWLLGISDAAGFTITAYIIVLIIIAIIVDAYYLNRIERKWKEKMAKQGKRLEKGGAAGKGKQNKKRSNNSYHLESMNGGLDASTNQKPSKKDKAANKKNKKGGAKEKTAGKKKVGGTKGSRNGKDRKAANGRLIKKRRRNSSDSSSMKKPRPNPDDPYGLRPEPENFFT